MVGMLDRLSNGTGHTASVLLAPNTGFSSAQTSAFEAGIDQFQKKGAAVVKLKVGTTPGEYTFVTAPAKSGLLQWLAQMGKKVQLVPLMLRS